MSIEEFVTVAYKIALEKLVPVICRKKNQCSDLFITFLLSATIEALS
jgi:hypothetical protein